MSGSPVIRRSWGSRIPEEFVENGRLRLWEASQSDLAIMANVARTTANATLRKLVSAGQIKLAYGRVVVVKPGALRAMLAE